MNFYYADATNQPIGPVSAEQLRNLYQRGEITLDTFVIPEGATNWHAYRRIHLYSKPPPPPPFQAKTRSKHANLDEWFNFIQKKIAEIAYQTWSKGIHWKLKTIAKRLQEHRQVLIISLAILTLIKAFSNDAKVEKEINLPPPKPLPQIHRSLKAKDFMGAQTCAEIEKNLFIDVKGRKEGFGNLLITDITINNKSKHTLKDITIIINTFGPSGTLLERSQHTLFETFRPFTEKTIPNFNAGFTNQQASKLSSSIVDFNLIPIPE
jgi:hypothetical protein